MIYVAINKLIALDDGHGASTAGKRTPYIPELGRFIHENEFNREVVKYLDDELQRHGFNTLLLAPTDADTPLPDRTALANEKKADLLISVHFNAMDGIFHGEGLDPDGFSAHVYSTLYESAKFGRIALSHLAKGTVQKNRGLVQQNLHMTRESNMPAVLLELGFMDNKREALMMLETAFQQECALEIAQAVCEYYGVSYKKEEAPVAPPAEAQLYRVRKSATDAKSQLGAFTILSSAKSLADKNAGYEVYCDGKLVYAPKAAPAPVKRVVIGTATVKTYALNVRKSADFDSAVVGTVKKGDKLSVYAEKNGLLEIDKGWVSAGTAYVDYAKNATKNKHAIPTVTLRYGSKGPQCIVLQNCLNAANFKLKGEVGPNFGPDTLQALKRFQSVYTPYDVDGIAGAKTRAALDDVLNG